MKKYVIIILLLILFILNNLYSKEKMKIAILDFSYNETKINKGIVNDIVELFISAFINTGAFDVIERNKLQLLMQELSLQNSDDFNDQFRQELGNLYGVKAVILGSVTKIGKNITREQ